MLEALLEPRTVAVIGVSRSSGKVGHEIFANLLEGGFDGDVVPVNPSAEAVLGNTCYPDLGTYGKKIDLAVIAIPARVVRQAVQDSLDAGAKAVAVITAGFREVGPAGAELEREISEMCARRGARLLGPNCLGVINSHHRMNASFAHHMPSPGGISVMSQSGALCTAMLDWAASRRLGLAKLISIGNKADLDETDFLATLAGDDDTKVIVGYLENIKSGERFISAAEGASSKKPVVIMKSGVTGVGGKAASSHTGSLAGADIAYGAAFTRSGVIRAERFEALFDYAMAFAMQPLPKGPQVAIITNAGGPGIMAADAADLAGLDVCTLERASATALRSTLPSAASVANPIDVLGDADPERYAAAVRAAQDDPAVDAILVILTPQAMTRPVETAEAVARCARSDTPILACFMGGLDVRPGRDTLMAAGVPDYPFPERAVAALKAMVEYSSWLRRPPRVVEQFDVDQDRAGEIITRHRDTDRLQVGEAAAKDILRAYGFNVPPGSPAATAGEAVEVARQIGYPAAMKIASPDIIHKSDIGGVALSLSSDQDVAGAFDRMMEQVARHAPEASIEGVYVERMCPPGMEVILGMSRDPVFGPMLMFGLGGIFVEVMKDVTFHIAPITESEAMQMLEGTKSYALLTGARGRAGVDLSAIAGALQRISQLATDFPAMLEMDINPFIVRPAGSPSVAADARITLKGTGGPN